MKTTSCPNCRTAVATVTLARLGGVCASCLSSFVLEGEPFEEAAAVRPEPPLPAGASFHGLEVIEVVGWGGMGMVYKCRQPDLDRLVALKVLNPALAADEEFARRFNGEARAMAALNHPNIVQVFDFGLEGGLCFLVMEYVEGEPLRALIRDRKIAPTRAARIAVEVCDALDYAHSHGVVHRDIKPENILIPARGSVKIADFGLAKMAGLDEAGSPATRASRVLGTPNYVAPEILAREPADHRADIYSLGVVLYEALVGEAPVGKFEPPSRRATVDPRFDAIVLKALERDPRRRFSSVAEFQSRLRPLTLPSRPRRWIVPAAVVAVMLAIGAWILTRPEPPVSKPAGIAKWHWVNRGELAETSGVELVVPPYRNSPLITASPQGHRLTDDAVIRFELRYEIHPKDEPWIILMFDGPDADAETRALILFPQGDHKVALAHQELPGGFTLLDLKPLPEGRPAPESWHRIEASWYGPTGRLWLKVDGLPAYEGRLENLDLSGSWKFAFGGAAKSIRIRNVNVVNQQ